MESIFSFLRDLAAHNNREWFGENKKRYQQSLDRFRVFVAEVLGGITLFDPLLRLIEAKDTIFRIYKDTRFSKDKTPYKTNFGCWMSGGGRRSADAGYYFHLEPDGCFMAAGVWMPPAGQLQLIRQEIIFDPVAFSKVFHDQWINQNYERTGAEDKLKKGPAGFPKDFELLDELKYKHYVFSKNYSDMEVVRGDFPQKLVEDYRGLFPVVHYLNQAMSYTGNE